MSVNPIPDSLDSEHIVAVIPQHPTDTTFLDWRRRLNLFPKRALSDSALTVEQRHRSARLAMLGQLVSPGVVSGLEAFILKQTFLQVNAGMGITVTGEDVVLPSARSISWENIIVYPNEQTIKEIHQPEESPPDLRLCILVLQPIEYRDPKLTLDAFSDPQVSEGCRVVLFPWRSVQWLLAPNYAVIRNFTAYSIFELEKNLAIDEVLPWETIGVPIALVGCGADWMPHFIDRHAVVRMGGKAKQRRSLVTAAGNPFVWQAQIEQFIDQLNEFDLNQLAQVTSQLGFLPPVGILPKTAIDLRAAINRQPQSHFFPSFYTVELAPITSEQIDLIAQECASLAPFNLTVSEQVSVLVPVPQSVFDPNLLKKETENPEFQTALNEFIDRRATWLNRGQIVQKRQLEIERAIVGSAAKVPSLEASEAELNHPKVPFNQNSRIHLSPVERGYHQHSFGGVRLSTASRELNTLETYIYLDPQYPPKQIVLKWLVEGNDKEYGAYWGENHLSDDFYHVGDLPELGQWVLLKVTLNEVNLNNVVVKKMAFGLFDGQAAWAQTSLFIGRERIDWITTGLPTGATAYTDQDGWNWLGGNERWTPLEDAFQTRYRSRSHISQFHSDKYHQHHFQSATETLKVESGDKLTTYIYLNPQAPPKQVFLQWKVGNSWEHRAYWGDNIGTTGHFPYGGTEGTVSLRRMGNLPEVGKWVKLEVPANQVDLDNKIVDGMAFGLFGGWAAWAQAGKVSAKGEVTIWVDNDLPFQSVAHTDQDGWSWIANDDEWTLPSPSRGSNQMVVPLEWLRKLLQSQIPWEVQQLSPLGLQDFIALLESKVQQSNDKIDLHFLRIQTDIYRVRQIVLGTDRASRLVTSPALATIAQEGISARATQEQIVNVFEQRKSEQATTTKPFRDVTPETRQTPQTSAPQIHPPEVTAGISTPAPLYQRSLLSEQTTQAISAISLPPLDISISQGQPMKLSPVQFDAPIQTMQTLRQLSTARTVASSQSRQSQVSDVSIIASQLAVSKPSPIGAIVDDILDQAPGLGAEEKTVTLAERLQESSAKTARRSALDNRNEVFQSLKTLSVYMNDVQLPTIDAKSTGKDTDDEAVQFKIAVDIIDTIVAALRLAEARVKAYRAAIATCKIVLNQLLELRKQANQRLQMIQNEIAEARQDVSVAKALLVEEQQRVQQINQKRDRILEQVEFLVFHRPRQKPAFEEVPLRPLLPGETIDPVPACLEQQVSTPPELQAMLHLVREAPLSWFVHFPSLLDHLGQIDPLLRMIEQAKQRTTIQLPIDYKPEIEVESNRISYRLHNVIAAHHQTIQFDRLQTSQLNLKVYQDQSWKLLRNQAETLLTLGDLIDGIHGNVNLIRLATQQLDNIAKVASCLYAAFHRVVPVIRLKWAEGLSQFDVPVDLRSLANLPRWSEIPYLEQKQMQALVDWLIQRVNLKEPKASAMMNDLIRVCLLLASHAPVNKIVSGWVAKPTIATVGNWINLVTQAPDVRIGMAVLLYTSNNQLIAQGIVEDLTTGQASAKITHVFGAPNPHLSTNTYVQFVESSHLVRY